MTNLKDLELDHDDLTLLYSSLQALLLDNNKQSDSTIMKISRLMGIVTGLAVCRAKTKELN